MPHELTDKFMQIGFMSVNIAIGFFLFWVGQFLYQKVFRRMDLNIELFVRDNPAVAIALCGYYLGWTIALFSVLDKPTISPWVRINVLAGYGAIAMVLMFAGAWIGDRLILRHLDAAREIREENNMGAAAVEAGLHISNGLILSTALAGESGSWGVGLGCWGIGMCVLVAMSYFYPTMASYKVFSEIRHRNNPAAGVAFAGLLIASGNIVRIAFSPEFQNWTVSLLEYGFLLGIGLLSLAVIRWVADWVLVPGVKISDEIVNQSVPNFGAGLIEAIAYICGSFLVSWSL